MSAGRGAAAAGRPTALHVSPHPDDEVLGAGATLVTLRQAGWRVVNLACGLGRPADHARRAAELAEALQRLRLDGRVADPPIALGPGDDLDAAVGRVTEEVGRLIGELGAVIVVSPHVEDAHHGHVAVARGVEAAVTGTDDVAWWTWGLWSDVRQPVVYNAFGEDIMAELVTAMAAHRGELQRNRYLDLLPARARRAAILGSEQVFGFGTGAASELPYAELLGEAVRVGGQWTPGRPRLLDPADPR